MGVSSIRDGTRVRQTISNETRSLCVVVVAAAAATLTFQSGRLHLDHLPILFVGCVCLCFGMFSMET